MSIKISVHDQQGQVLKEKSLSPKVFAISTNEALIHQAMVAQMSNERQVLAHTKDRSEVRGGGKKPWRQKGTGRARVGSSRSPIWTGGGVTFGPTKDRNFKKDINKKMRKKALLMVFSDKVKEKAMLVVDKLNVNDFKTKEFSQIITNLEKNIKDFKKRSLLVIDDSKNIKLKYSGRNLAGVKIINLENVNILDLLKYRFLLLTESAIDSLEKKYQA
jgi:large subunit ribosomal protein L4